MPTKKKQSRVLIYLDHHATTPLDPAALQAMLPLLQSQFANAGSVTHEAGRQVAALVDDSRAHVAEMIGAADDEIVFTSGATESNNLALFGACLRPRQKRRKIVSVVSEHPALLDPLERLGKQGFEVQLAPVLGRDSICPGQVCLETLDQMIDDDTALVSVMLANNEIGVIQPIPAIAQLCRQRDAILHTDASQAVGRIPVNVDMLGVDLLSFSAHKFYGPKGVGGLFVRRRERRVRLQPQIVGGGQQQNLRSGTLNTAGIIGMRAALSACHNSMAEDTQRMFELRSRLFVRLRAETGCFLNGPLWAGSRTVESEDSTGGLPVRHAGNLNVCFYPIEGQSLMLEVPELAISSGSACTSADPRPSHVLTALGLSEDEARSSIRLGVGRFTTVDEIERAADLIQEATRRLLPGDR
ncbi:MAG: cysteine desulfurase family protein [Pirellulaceae bacterium]